MHVVFSTSHHLIWRKLVIYWVILESRAKNIIIATILSESFPSFPIVKIHYSSQLGTNSRKQNAIVVRKGFRILVTQAQMFKSGIYVLPNFAFYGHKITVVESLNTRIARLMFVHLNLDLT